MSKKKPAEQPTPQAASPQPEKKRHFRLSDEAILWASSKDKSAPLANPYAVAVPPPGVVPASKRGRRLAMDDALPQGVNNWAFGGLESQIYAEGLTFLGYPYLSELALRGEYRAIVDTIAEEMTRKFIKIISTGDKSTAKLKSDKIKRIQDEFERLNVRGVFRKVAAQDGYFGRSHFYIDTGANDDEMKTSIGDGRSRLSKYKLKGKKIRALIPVEAVWAYPTNYNSNDPLKLTWYRPTSWYVMSREIHSTRFLTFVGREVPDLLKPAFAFGGLSQTQIAQPYVNNWLRTRQSVADVVHSYSTNGIKTDMDTIITEGGEAELIKRAQFYNRMRDNRGLMLMDKDSEDFFQFNTPLGGLDSLQGQSQEHMAAISRIPLVKLLGIQPTGLNADSEGVIRTFNDMIHGYQEHLFGNHLTTIVDIIQLSLFEEIDPEIGHEFEQLTDLTDKEMADLQKTRMDIDTGYLNAGVLAAEEIRQRLADDPDSGYSSIDVDAVPEQDMDADLGATIDPDTGMPMEEPETIEAQAQPNAEGEDSRPFGQDEWKEGDHPRADNGQFGSGASINPKSMKQVGGQKGSNPGGVYQDNEGKRFYVKKGKSKSHVRNEMLAAHLYSLAKSPTLKYRPVEGGEHIATEMEKLDKDNANKLSPAEIKQAQKDFVTHAWLANWDAAGLGGDNIGTIRGVPTSLDLGGALQYRAQGASKGGAFGNTVTELNTLRDKNMNRDAAKMFASMTPDQVRESAQKVTSIKDADIRAAVENVGESKELADKIIARKHDIAKKFNLASDEWQESKHPRVKGGENAGQFTSGSGGGGSSSTEKAVHKNDVAKLLSQPLQTSMDALETTKGLIKASTDADEKKELTAHLGAQMLKKVHSLTLKGSSNAEGWKKKFEKLPKDVQALAAEKAGPSYSGWLSLTDAQKQTAAKEQAKLDSVAPEPPSQVAPAQPKNQDIHVSPQDIEKAKSKNAANHVAIGASQYLPGVKELLEDFNSKWSGNNTPTSEEGLKKKAIAFQEMKAQVPSLQAKHQQAQAEKIQKAAESESKGLNEKYGPDAEKHFKELSAIAGSPNAAKSYLQYAHERIPNLQGSANITPGEAAHIVAYSGNAYTETNKALRLGVMSPERWKHVKSLNNALSKLPAYVGETRRGTTLTKDVASLYKPGMIVEERGFMSTAKGLAGFHGNTEFRIKGKSGRDISKLSSHPGEKEVLFPSGTRFIVKSNNGGTIELEEVD